MLCFHDATDKAGRYPVCLRRVAKDEDIQLGKQLCFRLFQTVQYLPI